MEKKNYNNMYKAKNLKEINEEVATAPVEELSKEEVVEPKIEKKEVIEETPKEMTPKAGIVVGGLSLNVRNEPNGDIIRIINNGDQVIIIDDSNPDWYKIDVPVQGFVMKKFIQLI